MVYTNTSTSQASGINQDKIDFALSEMQRDYDSFNKLPIEVKNAVADYATKNNINISVRGVPLNTLAENNFPNTDEMQALKTGGIDSFVAGTIKDDPLTNAPNKAHVVEPKGIKGPTDENFIPRTGIEVGGSDHKAKVKKVNMDALYGKKGTYGRAFNEKIFGTYDEYGNKGVGLNDYLGIGKAGYDIWQSHQAGKLAEESLEYQKNLDINNSANQKMITNDQLARDQRWREMTAGATAEQADARVADPVWKDKHQLKAFKG